MTAHFNHPKRILDQMLDGNNGVTGIMDDILFAALTMKEHDKILRKVVDRATSYSLRLNFNKCHIHQSAAPYVEHGMLHILLFYGQIMDHSLDLKSSKSSSVKATALCTKRHHLTRHTPMAKQNRQYKRSRDFGAKQPTNIWPY
ncbi:hypothetical protein GOODEAATRI_020300 [Goodea atripinnis]|uniref:Reverse transcriptase n=1 Tax=Goodea atripinnis TaxID=208336 RepID=A0ABV0NWK9_9TELE